MTFHLSLVTHNLERQRAFYLDLIGCKLARTTAEFEDFDFFGHQLTFHARASSLGLPYAALHFGANVGADDYDRILERLVTAGASFVVEPQVQAGGTVDERRKFVVLDPSGYAVEFKCYLDDSRALLRAAAYPRDAS